MILEHDYMGPDYDYAGILMTDHDYKLVFLLYGAVPHDFTYWVTETLNLSCNRITVIRLQQGYYRFEITMSEEELTILKLKGMKCTSNRYAIAHIAKEPGSMVLSGKI